MSRELLKALGKPFDLRATIDFETYRDKEYNLDKLTTEAYVRDPRFEAIGVGIKWPGQESVWLEEWEFREWARRVDWSRVALNAFHAHFEGLILSHHYGITPGFWFDPMLIAKAIGGFESYSLGGLSQDFAVGKKGDEVHKHVGKHREDFTQREWLAFGEYCRTDCDLTDKLLDAELPTFPRTELWLIDTTIRMFTEPVFEGDLAVLEKTFAEERRRKAELYAKIAERIGPPPPRSPRSKKPPQTQQERVKEVLGSGEKFAALLGTFGVKAPRKVSPKTGKPAFAFAKDDSGMKALLEHPDEEIRLLAQARLEVKSTIIGSRTERMIGCVKRGRVPFYLNYCGAHTHRWSGGDKMNPQNFNRGGALRAAILAAIGFVLAVADSGQIEARVVAWLAGAKALLDIFRRNDAIQARHDAEFNRRGGKKLSEDEAKALHKQLVAEGFPEGDFYSDVGSTFFLQKISKKETPVERQLSKNMVLGLGFSMAWLKFATELLKGMLGSKPVQFTMKEVAKFKVNVEAFREECESRRGRDGKTDLDRIKEMANRLTLEERVVHCAVAAHFVHVYRKAYAEIPRLWQSMDKVIQVMAEKRAGEKSGTVRMTFGPLKVIEQGIIKPNGLVLRYPGLRRGKEGWTYYNHEKRQWKKIYGGLLTENVVQSLARDIMAEQALWIRLKYPKIGTTTHDEIVNVPPQEQGEECLAYMLERMRVPPRWCSDLPLNAEGGVARSYGEAK